MNRKIGLNIEMNVNFQLKSVNLDAATFIYKTITIFLDMLTSHSSNSFILQYSWKRIYLMDNEIMFRIEQSQ